MAQLSYYYDVIVIGGGEAVLSAAIAAREEGASVALISKGKAGFGGSSVISDAVHSAIFSPGDSPDLFYEDILKGGRYISDKKRARVLAEESTLCVENLEKKYRIPLKREKKVRTPGHSFPRRVYAGNGQGRNITQVLASYAREIKVNFHEKSMVIDLIRNDNAIVGIYSY